MKLPWRMALMLVLVMPAMAVMAESSDEQYVGIYYLIEQGDGFSEKGQLPAALAKYSEAQGELKKFQYQHPDWNNKIVNFRLSYLETKISAISTKLAPPPPPPPAAAP